MSYQKEGFLQRSIFLKVYLCFLGLVQHCNFINICWPGGKQTKRRCDISTVVITIPIGPTRRKQPQGGLIIFTRGNERML